MAHQAAAHPERARLPLARHGVQAAHNRARFVVGQDARLCERTRVCLAPLHRRSALKVNAVRSTCRISQTSRAEHLEVTSLRVGSLHWRPFFVASIGS